MSRTFARLCETKKEWEELREVFVQVLATSPLYQYIAPDENIRDEFLRRYLNARHHTHLRCGTSLLVAIHVMNTSTEVGDDQSPDKDKELCSNEASRIVGGVLFVATKNSGAGYDYTTDNACLQSYDRYKLKEIDVIAFERLQGYQRWEDQFVGSEVMRLRRPLWNGSLCAIDPKYSDCLNYAYLTRIIAQKIDQLSEDRIVQINAPKGEMSWSENSEFIERLSTPCKTIKTADLEQKGRDKWFSNSFLLKFLHCFSLLTRHAYIPPQPASRPRDEFKPFPCESTTDYVEASHCSTACHPLVWTVSHSHLDVHFHQKNGFCCVKEVPFAFFDEGKQPFSSFLLLGDVFETGKLKEIVLNLASLELNNNIPVTNGVMKCNRM